MDPTKNPVLTALAVVVRNQHHVAPATDSVTATLEAGFGYRSRLVSEVMEYVGHLARRAGYPYPDLLAQVARGAVVAALSVLPTDLPETLNQEPLREDEFEDYWGECEQGTCPTCRILASGG